MGSGMGTLLEALWCYFVNQELVMNRDFKGVCELAWLVNNEYNDYACLEIDGDWNSQTRDGEFFRIEAKSMNLDADESKAHFDELSAYLSNFDLLLVLVWKWSKVDDKRSFPKIVDSFLGRAKPIAMLRDELHVARGGSFVGKDNCPDNCKPDKCTHDGEPLNAEGKRERLSGPQSRRPSSKVSFAANFGGLIRMLKTSSTKSQTLFRKLRKENDVMNEYISFIHRNYLEEETNQYSSETWRELAKNIGIPLKQGMTKKEVILEVREADPSYMEKLRQI